MDAATEHKGQKCQLLKGRLRPHLPGKLQRGLDRLKGRTGHRDEHGHGDDHGHATPGVASTPGSKTLLVHGKSGIVQTEEQLAELVADVLPGWCSVDRSSITVENVSAEGDGSVYKVAATGGKPPKVALHIWDEDSDDILKERTTQAGEIFAKAGLGPRRLAHGGDWFVEPWEGSGEPEWTEDRLTELGELVAKVHSIPTEWYEVHRRKICERMPAMRQVALPSHAWTWTSRDHLLGDLSPECLQAWLGAQFLAPTSPLAARVVTSHADCHGGNMLQTDAGVLLIDFEWACVTCAAQDLAFVIKTTCDDELDKKRTFMKAYASAVSSTEVLDAVIDDMIFDAEVFFLATHCGGPLELWEAHDEPEEWLQIFRTYEAFVPCARLSPGLRQAVLEKGIVQYVKELEALLRLDAPLVLCPPHDDAVHERLLYAPDGTICCEARQDLILGLGAQGAVTLVRRDDVARRLIFQPPAPQHSRQFRLALASHPGRALAASPYARQVGPGPGLSAPGLVQPLVLGTPDTALVVSLDGGRLGPALAPPGQPARVLHVGDPVQELRLRINRALWFASEEGDIEDMEELVKQGADVNWANNESIGHPAAREGHLDAIEFLLSHGYDVNKSGKMGGSALIEAATHAHVDIVRRLLAVPGIKLDTQEDDKTALDWARDPEPHSGLTEEHGEVVKMLVAAGCPSGAAAAA